MIDTDELRKSGTSLSSEFPVGGEMIIAAADEIDALRAEAAELQRHVEILQGYRKAAQKLIEELTKERDGAREDVAYWQTAYEDKCREVKKWSDAAADYLAEREEARRWARKYYKLYNDSIAADIMSRDELLRDVMKMRGKRPNWPE